MNIKRRNKAKPDFNMSAMTDIGFLLLIFFILNYSMPEAMKILLPNAKGKTTSNKSITLAVSSDLIYSVNGQEVAFENVESTLTNAINIAKTKTDEPTVVLNIDKTVELEKVVEILQIGNDLKVQMILATKPETK